MKFLKINVIVLLTILSLMVITWFVHSNLKSAPLTNQSTTGFSASKAYDHVKYLVQKVGPRPAGSKSELKAAQYISYVLNQNGWKVRQQSFSKVVVREVSVMQREQKVELINSQNIIAELPGKRPDTIVVGAHYDSANLNAPGAVDNASGVGVLLELARVLSQEPHEETYQLVFFGAEEYGLVGSQYYVAQADLSAVRWMLNVDMVGAPLEIDVAGKRSAPPELIRQVTAIAKDRNIPFHLSRDFIMMTRESSQGGASDFSSFLDKGIPALGLGISGRPAGYFHRPEDQLDRVSLQYLQNFGDYSLSLLETVRMEKLGPHTWDELFLPFQIGKNVIILPSFGTRIFTFFTFLLTGLILIKFLKKNTGKKQLNWKRAFVIIGVTLLLSLIVIGISGLGEIVWRGVKQVQTIYYAFPAIFILARIGIALGSFIFIASWFYKVPLVRDPQLYWFTGVILLLGVSLVFALIRIDLAFPFVVWLLCLDLQFFLPTIFLVLIGPYFIYKLHFELLNSYQWVSYYKALHDYFWVFLCIYTLLLIPFFLAALHVAISKIKFFSKLLYSLRKPAILVTGLLILSLGLVPIYTNYYPQTVTVQEEWSGSSDGKVHIFSDERLPVQLVKDLDGQNGKSIYVPISNEKPPLKVDTSVAERNGSSQRVLNISFKLTYTSEPYLIRLKFDSAHPFEVKTDEFLPMSKLPRKLQLKGVLQPTGNYTIILQRTPPQRNIIQLSVETESILSCSVEGVFPDPSPRTQIQNALLSVDYLIQYKENFQF
ncbi:MAG: M28 family metallopeptidase [Bacillota bacterium]|nr:M28 family metallopeptidase [Bacillota bacterium]